MSNLTTILNNYGCCGSGWGAGFGGLTGGLFGGGFGGSIFGAFGNYGFSPFTNCCGETNFDALAGFAAGSAVFNVAAMALGSTITRNREEKIEHSTETYETKIDNVNKKIDSYLDVLGTSATESNYASIELEASYTEDVNSAQSAVSKTTSALEKAETDLEAIDTSTTDGAKKYAEQKTAVEKLKTQLKKDKAELEAAKKAKETREAEIKEAKEKIAELIEERTELEKERDSYILDRADAKKIKRVTTEDLNGKFNEDGTLAQGSEVSARDLRASIYAFRNSNQKETKLEYAKKFIAIYDSDSINKSKLTVDMQDAYDIMKEYVGQQG